jgi:hypothetical protein
MTGRIGAMAMDGTPISATDVARMEADEELQSDWQRKAVRVVAASAHDVDDCRLLLAILGLDVGVIADARRAATAGSPDTAPAPNSAAAPESPAEAEAKDGKRSTEAA